MKHAKEIAILCAICVLMAILPLILPAYFLSLFFMVYMAICLAQSWNLLAGYTGYISFGHAAFFGVGAYASAILITKMSIHWMIAAMLGGVAASIIALTLGLPLIMFLRGPYFAISMLGLFEVLRIVASSWDSLTGGGYGLSISPDVVLKDCYYAMGLLVIVTCYTIYKLIRSQYGYRLIAIREDELAANTMGINTLGYKLFSFGLSAFFCGVAGGIFAWYQSFLDPSSAFSFPINIQMIAVAVFGGLATILGPIVGGLILLLFSEVMWTYFAHIHQIIYGLLIVMVVMFLPEGIVKLRPSRLKV